MLWINPLRKDLKIEIKETVIYVKIFYYETDNNSWFFLNVRAIINTGHFVATSALIKKSVLAFRAMKSKTRKKNDTAEWNNYRVIERMERRMNNIRSFIEWIPAGEIVCSRIVDVWEFDQIWGINLVIHYL